MDFSLPKALIDAGGWVTAAAVVIAVLGALVKGVFVLKREYDKEVARADKATDALEAQTSVSKQFGEDVSKLGTQVEALVTVLGQILKLRTGGD